MKLKKYINQIKVRHTSKCREAMYRVCTAIPWKVRDKYYKTRDFFFPRNQWARDVIPNHWSDKTTLIPDLMFAGVIDFVDNEKVFDRVVLTKKHKKELREVYEWAKTGRIELQNQIDKAYPEIASDKSLLDYRTFNTETYEDLYAEVIRLEAIRDKMNTKHLTWIVKNRHMFWV